MVNETFGQGTPLDVDPRIEFQKDTAKLTAKQQCLQAGGRWDEASQSCFFDDFLDKKKDVEVQPPKVDATGPETFTSSETGKPSGVTIDGKTYLGINADDIQKITAGKQAEEAKLEGTAPVGTAQAQANEQFRIQQQIDQIGKIGRLTPAQQADINYSQAITAGTVGQIPAILTTAGTFAAGGALAGGPLGAAVGAGIGLVAGITRGILGNIKEQQRGELQAADIELTNARTNMRQLAMLASQDPANADVYIKQYNDQLTRIHQARRQTAAEVAGDLNAFMEDGREQLADFDAFLQSGGIADVYGQKLEIALSSNTGPSLDALDIEALL